MSPEVLSNLCYRIIMIGTRRGHVQAVTKKTRLLQKIGLIFLNLTVYCKIKPLPFVQILPISTTQRAVGNHNFL